MRTNGYLQVKIVTEGGFNDDGEPVSGGVDWGSEIPCSIKTLTDNRKGRYDDGEFRIASFIILIEERNDFYPSHIKLTRYDVELGEYKVQSIEPLKSVGRIQIQV